METEKKLFGIDISKIKHNIYWLVVFLLLHALDVLFIDSGKSEMAKSWAEDVTIAMYVIYLIVLVVINRDLFPDVLSKSMRIVYKVIFILAMLVIYSAITFVMFSLIYLPYLYS